MSGLLLYPMSNPSTKHLSIVLKNSLIILFAHPAVVYSMTSLNWRLYLILTPLFFVTCALQKTTTFLSIFRAESTCLIEIAFSSTSWPSLVLISDFIYVVPVIPNSPETTNPASHLPIFDSFDLQSLKNCEG